MNAWLIIGKQTREVRRCLPPIEPEMIACKRHQHRAHTKGNPAIGLQAAHRGINQGIAGMAGRPCLEIILPECALAHAFKSAMLAMKFKIGLLLKLLHKMASPCQTRQKGGEVFAQETRLVIPLHCQALHPSLGGLFDFPHRHRAIGNMRAQA